MSYVRSLPVALCFEIAPSADGGAPSRVQLLPAGPQLVGRDGRSWLFDASAVDAVLAAFERGKVDLPIDRCHATQLRAPSGEEAPAAAWITGLQAINGELWADVSWTDRGGQQVASREYRYLSPVFDFDPQTKRVMRLVSAGLVPQPNLPLQALNHEEFPMSRSTALVAAITGALGLAADAADDAVASAITGLKGAHEQALNSERQPSLERYVPRADYDQLLARATNAEQALSDHNKAALKARVDTAIAAALRDRKIARPSEGYYRAMCADESGLNQFLAFVASAPVIAPDTAGAPAGAPAVGTALNAEQQEVARLLGLSAADAATRFAKEA